MSDSIEEKTTTDTPASGKGILDQAKSAINKSAKDSVVSKAKELLTKKAEHMKAARQIDIQLAQLMKDFDDGIL